MTLADILDRQRGLYLEEFVLRATGFEKSAAAVMQSEALYRLGDDPVRRGALGLPARGDLCVQQNSRVEEIVRIESPRLLAFSSFRFVWGNALEVALHPFAWHDCKLCVPEPMQALTLSKLAQWLEAEIQPELTHGAPGNLLNVVHGMSEPRQAEDGVRFEVDFGSASVTAFESLLTALVDAGAGLVVVGQPALDQTPAS